MTDTKPLDTYLNSDVSPTNDELNKIFGTEPVPYVLTADQWGALKRANELMAEDMLRGFDLEGYAARVVAVNELVDAFTTNSQPRFTGEEATDPGDDEDVTVSIPASLMVGLFSGVHATWHTAHRGLLNFEEEGGAADALALIDATHTRALAYIQPFTSHFNHTFDGRDF